MSAFIRKITKMIEKMKTTNEGIQNPQTVAILEEMDKRLAKLEKASK